MRFLLLPWSTTVSIQFLETSGKVLMESFSKRSTSRLALFYRRGVFYPKIQKSLMGFIIMIPGGELCHGC